MQIKVIQVATGVIIILVVLSAIAVFFLNLNQPGPIDFFFKKNRYHEIVKAVKASPIAPGETQSFQLDKNLNPSTLQPDQKKTGDGRHLEGHLNVERTPTGDYVIELITVDDGHAGFSGYTFWDKPLKPNETPPQPAHEPGHIYKKLNEHWCAFTNNKV